MNEETKKDWAEDYEMESESAEEIKELYGLNLRFDLWYTEPEGPRTNWNCSWLPFQFKPGIIVMIKNYDWEAGISDEIDEIKPQLMLRKIREYEAQEVAVELMAIRNHQLVEKDYPFRMRIHPIKETQYWALEEVVIISDKKLPPDLGMQIFLKMQKQLESYIDSWGS